MSNDNQCSGENTPVKISSVLEPKSPKSSMMVPNPDANSENSKVSSLNVIALEYDNCNSDVEEEVEVDSNKTENQNTKPVSETQETLLEYCIIEKSVLSSSCNSDVWEEVKVDNNKTGNQNIKPLSKTQETQKTLLKYRTIEKSESSSEESDSEDDSSSSNSSIVITSSSSSSSDSSNSDNDSDDATRTSNDKEKKGNKAGLARRKKQIENEFDCLPPIEDLKISLPEDKCAPLGEIEKIVEQLVIVKPKPNKPTLHIETVLFIERGKRALGKILDIYGPVSEPNYCVRFNSSEHIQESNITVGMLVYYCPDTESGYTSLIFQQQLKIMKSHDTMGDDDEPPVFSDDEKERAYYESLKQKNNSSESGAARKRQRTLSFTKNKSTIEWQSTHPWNRNAQFRRCYQERQHALRNNGPPNLPQYGSYSCNDPWMQYQHQSNMYWPPVPRNIHPMLTGQNTEYGASFNESRLPPYGINYNPNSSGVTPNSQCNMQPQYPRIPFGAPPRFSPMFPSFPMSYPQFPTASLPHSDMFYHIPVRPPMHANALCTSLPPPPPPLTDSTTDN